MRERYEVTVAETNIYVVMAEDDADAEAIVFDTLRQMADPEYKLGQAPVAGEILWVRVKLDDESCTPVYDEKREIVLV